LCAGVDLSGIVSSLYRSGVIPDATADMARVNAGNGRPGSHLYRCIRLVGYHFQQSQHRTSRFNARGYCLLDGCKGH